MSLESINPYRTREILQKYFGYSDFHPLQEEIIKDVLNHNDVLVVIPTGGGKSLCYQLPAVMNEGISVVISPLIALMKDQVDDLSERGISATSINSALTYSEISETKSRLLKKQIKLLYVAPERIVIPDFLDFLRQLNVSLFAIDEAHCISEWGHEFRPEYRKLNLLKENFPAVPLIALTSTAIPQVQTDIVNQLNMVNPKIYRGSLNRKNLFYQIRPKNKEMFQHLLGYIKNHPNDSGIIYCQSRKSVDELSRKLQNKGIRALPYHAGLSSNSRNENQEKFVNDDVEIIVATIAFGMGIDKPNIRYVLHCDMPKSIEGYYQETGRAGRDGLKSDCILFFSYSDKIKHEYFIRKLEDEQNKRIAYSKLDKMIDFCTWSKCRRITLLNYFGEKYDTHNCNMCNVCVPSKKAEIASYSKPEVMTANTPKIPYFNYRKCSQKNDTIQSGISFSDNIRASILEVIKSFPNGAMSRTDVARVLTGLDSSKSAKNLNIISSPLFGRFSRLTKKEVFEVINNMLVSKDIEFIPKSEPTFGREKLRIPFRVNLGKIKSYSVTEIRSKCPSAYEKWTEAQEQKLINEYKNGKTISELAKLLGRQTGGIRSRLNKLNILFP
jgi:RecQ family ATP-dependent DNA helicase